MKVRGQFYTPVTTLPRERASEAHYIWGSVDPLAGSDAFAKGKNDQRLSETEPQFLGFSDCHLLG